MFRCLTQNFFFVMGENYAWVPFEHDTKHLSTELGKRHGELSRLCV